MPADAIGINDLLWTRTGSRRLTMATLTPDPLEVDVLAPVKGGKPNGSVTHQRTDQNGLPCFC